METNRKMSFYNQLSFKKRKKRKTIQKLEKNFRKLFYFVIFLRKF